MDKGHVLVADSRVDVLLDIFLPRAIAQLLLALVPIIDLAIFVVVLGFAVVAYGAIPIIKPVV